MERTGFSPAVPSYHINAAMAGLVGAYFLGKRVHGKESMVPTA